MSSALTREVRPALVLVATISATVLVVANMAALNVALPELSRQLQASQTDVHWMVDGYAVFLAALLLPAGAIGDRFGRRRILLAGLSVVIVSNLVVLGMDSPMPVIAARCVGGIGAAFVFPATLSTITSTLPHELRSRGVAMWTAATTGGGIAGIMGSGVLIENFWWGSVFLGVAIFAAIVLIMCWFFVPDSSDPDEAHLDPVGALLAFIGVGALVLGIVEGPAEGWGSPIAAGGIAVGLAGLVGFALWEWRNPRPLLPVRLFAQRGIRSGSLSIFVQFVASFGFFFVAVFYLAFVRGFGPIKTGLGLLPFAIGNLPGTAAAFPLARRFGRRTIGLVGLLVLSSAWFAGLTLELDTPFWQFGLIMALFGLGLGLAGPPATDSIIETLPKSQQGVASALNDVLREFGAAIGIALVGAAFNAGYRNSLTDIEGLPEPVVEAVRETPAAAAVLAPELGEAAPVLLAEVARSVLSGWDQAMWWAAIITIAGAALFAFWAPSRRDEGANLPAVAAAPSAVAPPVDIRAEVPERALADIATIDVRDPESVPLAPAVRASEIAGIEVLFDQLDVLVELADNDAVTHGGLADIGAVTQRSVAVRNLTAEIGARAQLCELADSSQLDILANRAARSSGKLATLANRVSLVANTDAQLRPVATQINAAASDAIATYRTIGSFDSAH